MGPVTKQRVLENNGKILSSYISQTNLVEGMDALGVDMDTLNGMNVKESVLKVIEPEQWSRNGVSQDICVGYRNVKYLNRLLKQKALCAAARKWAAAHREESSVVVFVYGMHTPFIAAACAVKQMIPHTRICLIVPDLPQYMDLEMSGLKKLLKHVDWMRIRSYMKKIDKYVLYAEPMADFLGLKDGQWTVMEGSYDSEQMAKQIESPPPRTHVHCRKTVLMYSGVLDMRYGIPELLDAMALLDDSYELWLTGDGNAVGLIQERAAADERIVFYGYLPSRQDLLDKQAEATMLISPRRDTEAGSKYCFPSKLFEYMVSGRPVISCYLEGIPKEYHTYLYQLPHVSDVDIANAVTKVARLTERERDDAGRAAKEFVLQTKNKYAQAKKLAHFMNVIECAS